MDLSEIEKFERAKVGTITLSEAIRIGCKVSRQYHGDYFHGDGACALGAAVLATIGREKFEMLNGKESRDFFIKTFGITHDIAAKVAEKNDESRASREQIADWLAALGY